MAFLYPENLYLGERKMIDKLFHILQKPTLWQRSDEAFWDDEHISKGMLEAHLSPDWDAASRKHTTIDHSVKWLSGIIPSQGGILDLGCGPGLYTKRLSDLGYNVTGMDFSKRSIEYAKSQDSKTEYIYKNYLMLDYNSKFDAITLIYCDYAALIPDERRNLIRKIHEALKPGGLFILDVFTGVHFKNKSNKLSWFFYNDNDFWSSKPHLCLDATYLYENNTIAVDQHIVVTNDVIKEYLVWNTAYTVQSLTDEITPPGFEVSGVFGDVCGNPYTGESDTLCIVLKRGTE